MRRVAMIANARVTMIAVWDGESEWTPGEQYALIDVTDIPEAKEGSYYIDGTFIND